MSEDKASINNNSPALPSSAAVGPTPFSVIVFHTTFPGRDNITTDSTGQLYKLPCSSRGAWW
jgi:hypothetical protein